MVCRVQMTRLKARLISAAESGIRPGRPLQQPLHFVWGRVPGLLGQRPAVLARQVADQPGDVLAGLAARLDPGKAARQAPHQLIQIPAGQRGLFYSGGSSRLKISGRQSLQIINAWVLVWELG